MDHVGLICCTTLKLKLWLLWLYVGVVQHVYGFLLAILLIHWFLIAGVSWKEVKRSDWVSSCIDQWAVCTQRGCRLWCFICWEAAPEPMFWSQIGLRVHICVAYHQSHALGHMSLTQNFYNVIPTAELSSTVSSVFANLIKTDRKPSSPAVFCSYTEWKYLYCVEKSGWRELQSCWHKPANRV